MALLAAGVNRVLRGRTPDPNSGTLLLAVVALSVLFVVLGVGAVISGQALRRYESLIAAIMRGDTSRARLADEQPSKRGSKPALPFSVQLRPDSRRVATYVLIVLGGLEVVLLIEAVVGLRGSLREAAHYMLISLLAVLLFMVPMICALFIVAAHQRITLKADSLIVRLAMSYQDQQAMAWDDAQVFTISPPGEVGSPPLRYELVGRRCAVRWVRAQERSRPEVAGKCLLR
jgi:hypothetical protein